ncbi:MAG: DHHA1 domain-containing protein [Eubacteriales bacterium]|nr:DHHA1 domain-containing protein [Eubacteriales bacterium]
MIDIRINIMNRLLEAREKKDCVYLYPHVGADGDALGSSLALLLVLKKLHIPSRLLLDEPVSPKLGFLPHLDAPEVFAEGRIVEFETEQKIALAVDCADSERTGRRQVIFDSAEVKMALDHHVSSGESGGLRYIDAHAAAAAEIIADLIADFEQHLNMTLMDRSIATLLMAALISDTGRFVYSNTTSRSFRTAAWLMEYEPDIRMITYQLFDLNSQTRLRLTGRIFTDTEFCCDGRLAIALVDQNLLSEYGATEHDLEGIVSQLRNVEGVEVSFVLRQHTNGDIKVNIRSSDGFNASEFARSYGGGGHPKAAGMTLKSQNLQQTAQQLKQAALRFLP